MSRDLWLVLCLIALPATAQAQASRPADPALFPALAPASSVMAHSGTGIGERRSAARATDAGTEQTHLARRFAEADSVKNRSWTPVIMGAAVMGAFGAFLGYGFCRYDDNAQSSNCPLSMIGGAALGAGVGSILGAILGTIASP